MSYAVYRNYVESGWCKQEFILAHYHNIKKLQKGHKKYLILILAEDIEVDDRLEQLKSYLTVYTYIDARKFCSDQQVHTQAQLESLRKRIAFAMPGRSL